MEREIRITLRAPRGAGWFMITRRGRRNAALFLLVLAFLIPSGFLLAAPPAAEPSESAAFLVYTVYDDDGEPIGLRCISSGGDDVALPGEVKTRKVKGAGLAFQTEEGNGDTVLWLLHNGHLTPVAVNADDYFFSTQGGALYYTMDSQTVNELLFGDDVVSTTNYEIDGDGNYILRDSADTSVYTEAHSVITASLYRYGISTGLREFITGAFTYTHHNLNQFSEFELFFADNAAIFLTGEMTPRWARWSDRDDGWIVWDRPAGSDVYFDGWDYSKTTLWHQKPGQPAVMAAEGVLPHGLSPDGKSVAFAPLTQGYDDFIWFIWNENGTRQMSQPAMAHSSDFRSHLIMDNGNLIYRTEGQPDRFFGSSPWFFPLEWNSPLPLERQFFRSWEHGWNHEYHATLGTFDPEIGFVTYPNLQMRGEMFYLAENGLFFPGPTERTLYFADPLGGVTEPRMAGFAVHDFREPNVVGVDRQGGILYYISRDKLIRAPAEGDAKEIASVSLEHAQLDESTGDVVFIAPDQTLWRLSREGLLTPLMGMVDAFHAEGGGIFAGGGSPFLSFSSYIDTHQTDPRAVPPDARARLFDAPYTGGKLGIQSSWTKHLIDRHNRARKIDAGMTVELISERIVFEGERIHPDEAPIDDTPMEGEVIF